MVTRPILQKLDAIHWSIDDVKELLNNRSENEEKSAKEMDAFGLWLAAVYKMVQDLLKKVDDTIAKKPKM